MMQTSDGHVPPCGDSIDVSAENRADVSSDHEPGQRDRQRGRPRDPSIDQAIFGAANELIAERGYAAVTIGELAERAGVPKSTIYRRFGSREEVLLAAARETSTGMADLPNTGSLRGDLIELLQLQMEVFANGRIAQLALAAVNEPELGKVLSRLALERRVATVRVIERGVERGEIGADVDVGVVIDLVRGVGWSRYLEQLPFDEGLPEKVADYLLDGLSKSGRKRA
jgi:AcrR family transcriptional regulator